MGTTTTPRRRDYLRAVLTTAQATGDAVAPWQVLGDVEGHFVDEDDLLLELHGAWVRLLVGRLHRGRIVADRTPADVCDLYEELRAEHPTLRGILDAHGADPALREATAREHAMLARIAGLAPEGALDETAAGLGRSLVERRLPVQRAACA